MLFKVLSIYHGWFEVDFNRGWPLINSNYQGCDAPCLLLEALGDLLENKASEAWLCWQDEPGASILNLEKIDEMLFVRIYAADTDSYHLDYSGAKLSNHITECLYKTESYMTEATKNILDEFSLYENGNGRQRYEVNWGNFPQQQYNRLKKLLKVN